MKPFSLVLCGVTIAALVVYHRRLSRTQLVLGALLAAWFAVRGSGIVHLPDLEESAKKVGPTLGGWTYVVVGVMAYLETGVFVGLLAPGEFTVILGGFVAGQGEIDVFGLCALVWACAFAGDVTSYVLGRRLGRSFLLAHGGRFRITRERLEQVEQFFERHGGKTILIGRFLGLVRALAPFIAGSSRVPARRFLPIDFVAAGAWSVTFVTLGYVFWQSFDEVVKFAKRGTIALGAVVVLIVAGVALYRWLDKPANRRRAREAWRTRSLEPLRKRV
ncbi:MAG: DedA family protein [Gaiellaceae bacterium]